MKKQLSQLEEFHKCFCVPWKGGNFGSVTEEVRDRRIMLMEEELKEVVEAMKNEPIENIAKELADLLYVVYGTIGEYGLQVKMEDVFDEVHRSNMSKLGADGKPILREDGKVLKGPNYKEADIKTVLKK